MKKKSEPKAKRPSYSSMSSDYCRPETDPSFKVYHELMRFKVLEILLVHTAYDAFIMEGDGTLASRIVTQYHGLNLSEPPRITLATSAGQALALIKKKHFDLVLTMPQVGDMDALSLAARIKRLKPELPVILISHGLTKHLAEEKGEASPLDNYYVWSSDPDLLLTIVKNLEDHKNAARDAKTASVRVLLLVEDSPVYRSFLLPLLYKEVMRQTQAVLDESLNEEHRLLKMRARPKILTADNFEAAIEIYRRFQKNIFGVAADTRFPKEGRLFDQAGISLLSLIREEVKDMPLLLLSAESSNRHQAEKIPAVFVDKNSADLGDRIHQFFLDHLGFGDFVFHDSAGRVIDRAVNLIELERKIRSIPADSLLYHARNNHFSNWIMARSEVTLSSLCQREALKERDTPEEIRQYLCSIIRDELKKRQQGIVSQFSERDFDAEIMEFVKCGNGAMGGKAQGLAFVSSYLRQTHVLCDLEGTGISIPRTFVVATDGFDSFMEENGLTELHRQHLTDGRITEIFVSAKLPKWLSQQLAVLLEQIDHPIIIRSSSVLEDAHLAPYAGLFLTETLANNDKKSALRLQRLETAIKRVYASALHAGPRAFARSRRQHHPGSMAIMVQQLIGHSYGSFFYPALSGVAQSRNFYPLSPMKPDEGIAHIALGFGKTVVGGEKSLSFSPAHPATLPQFLTIEDTLDNSQKYFYALPLRTANSRKGIPSLRKRRLTDATDEYPVRLFCSSYSPEDQKLRDTPGRGMPVLTFANILKHGLIPLPTILQELLRLCRLGTGGDVELEFCLDMNDGSRPPTFYILQLRPMTMAMGRGQIRIGASERKKAFCYSSNVLGHGVITGVNDILYVKPESFQTSETRQIASEIGRINAGLEKEKRHFLLIGPGRWGSADPWLGIPVRWQDINMVGAIIEMHSEEISADPSQGTHFFQNLISSGIHYISVDERKKQFLDHTLLSRLPATAESRYVKHIRLPDPLTIKTDSISGQSVLLMEQKAAGRKSRTVS
jgi:CheY-like chemotaxis protein